MKSVRTLLSIVVIGLLALGYAASQVAALGGTAAKYAAQIDSPSIQWLALLILLASVALAFVPDKEADHK